MILPYQDCEESIRALFDQYWSHDDKIVVLWGDDWSKNDIPATCDAWINMVVLFLEETVRAFGGGRFENERLLSGMVDISVFSKIGTGESTLLKTLDDVLAVYRSRRQGDLSFVSSPILLDKNPRVGVWRGRSALVPFEFRFRG